MEAATIVGAARSEPQPDPELFAFVGECVAQLPSGEGEAATRVRVDWLLEKLTAERARIRSVQEFTERRVDMIRTHGDGEVAKLQKRVAYLETKIREHLPHEGERFKREFGKKSLDLPNGKVGYRTVQPTVHIEDMEKAIRWAEEHRIEVARKEVKALQKTPVLDWIKATGELPPVEIIEYVDGYDKFYIETEGA